MSRAIFQVTPTQVVSFFGYGFEPARVFNPYQVYELYYSSLEPKAVTPAHVRLEDEALLQGFMDYLIDNDYGRYVDPETIEAMGVPPVLFFQANLIPSGNDMRDAVLFLSKIHDLSLNQTQGECVAAAYHIPYFVDGKVTRDTYFKGFLPQKAKTQDDIRRIINTVNSAFVRQKVESIIQELGYALHAVRGDENTPPFIYSENLVNKVGYEILACADIPTSALHFVVEELVKRSLEGPLELGDVVTFLTDDNDVPIRCQLIEADADRVWKEFVCQTAVEKPRVLQLIIADPLGTLPTEQGYRQDLIKQPVLIKPRVVA